MYNQRSLVECEGERQEILIAAGMTYRSKENCWVTERPPCSEFEGGFQPTLGATPARVMVPSETHFFVT